MRRRQTPTWQALDESMLFALSNTGLCHNSHLLITFSTSLSFDVSTSEPCRTIESRKITTTNNDFSSTPNTKLARVDAYTSPGIRKSKNNYRNDVFFLFPIIDEGGGTGPVRGCPEEMVYSPVEVTEKKSFRVILMMHCRLCLFVTQEWSGKARKRG